MTASPTNLALIARDRRLRQRMGGLPVAAGPASPMSRECQDMLEGVVKRLGVEARKTICKDSDVRMTLLQWATSAELVIVAKASAKVSSQLHYPIIAGTLIYEDENGVAMADVSGPAEAMRPFVETLKADVAAALAGSRFDAALASMPVTNRAKFN